MAKLTKIVRLLKVAATVTLKIDMQMQKMTNGTPIAPTTFNLYKLRNDTHYCFNFSSNLSKISILYANYTHNLGRPVVKFIKIKKNPNMNWRSFND
ncbi:hypothetical protein [Lactococcus garvieae]|uniref:hypothetical protein n=1 Tax=Lactococcus garvieae TaxID=1363 RepID=UPI00398EBC25